MNKSALSEKETAVAVAEFRKLGVHSQLAEAAAGLGWKKPSAIQEQAIPQLLQGARHSVANFTSETFLVAYAYQRPRFFCGTVRAAYLHAK